MNSADLYTYLNAHSGLSNLVETRIYPGRLPDPASGHVPAVVYQLVSSPRMVAHDGVLPDTESRYQFDAWATTHVTATDVAGQLTAALLGYTGDMGSTSVAIPRRTNEFDSYEDDTGLYRVTVEFIIWHANEGNS